MLNLLNNCQYVKLEFPELCFIILNTFNLYTLSSIKDESSTESHKTFLFQAKMKPIKCICDEISIECKTGLTPETANDYFCKNFIKSKTCCQSICRKISTYRLRQRYNKNKRTLIPFDILGNIKSYIIYLIFIILYL